jgi:hypothetical protein
VLASAELWRSWPGPRDGGFATRVGLMMGTCRGRTRFTAKLLAMHVVACLATASLGQSVAGAGYSTSSSAHVPVHVQSLECNQWDLTHTGCDLPAGSGLECADVTLK